MDSKLERASADNILKRTVSLHEILAMEPRALPYDKVFEQVRGQPAILIYTSGTIGKQSKTL